MVENICAEGIEDQFGLFAVAPNSCRGNRKGLASNKAPSVTPVSGIP